MREIYESLIILKEIYPEVLSYIKNGYWYVVPNEDSGNTLGSGITRQEAYDMAADNVMNDKTMKNFYRNNI